MFDLKKLVGQAADAIIPGDQSSWHQPATTRQAQPAQQAPPARLINTINQTANIGPRAIAADNAAPKRFWQPGDGQKTYDGGVQGFLQGVGQIPVLGFPVQLGNAATDIADRVRAGEKVNPLVDAAKFGVANSPVGPAAQLFGGAAHEFNKTMGLPDSSDNPLFGHSSAFSTQAKEQGLGTTLLNNALNVVGSAIPTETGGRLPVGSTVGEAAQAARVVNAKLGESGRLGIPGELPRRAPQTLNTDRLNISEPAKGEVNALSHADAVTHMTDKEVQSLAQNAGIDGRSHTIDQTRQKVGEQLNLRRKIVSMTNQADQLLADNNLGERAQILRQIQEFSRTSTEQGTDIARQLSARRILANELDSPIQRVFKLLDKEGVNPDVAAQKFAGVDFNDANAVVKAYRELVPPTKTNWLDTVRYNSMLSSPLTQINNIFPNIESTAVITPVEKTLTGLIDVAHSAMTGKPRQFAVGEGKAYAKGYFSSMGEAKRRFGDSLSGKTEAANLDMKGHVPMYAHGQNKLYDALSFPMRLMEAMDGFFTGLTEGGVTKALEHRQSVGIKTPNVANQAGAESAYRLYRQELGDKSQGKFLQALDIPAQKIMELRSSKSPYVSIPAKFTVPFVRTTMNIFKQGFEYSPAGVLTLHGATNKTEQVSKMLLGTAVVGTAGALLGQDKLTWAQPTNGKQLEAWKAAGMQPYSVKMGNNWVSFQKLPPAISFNLALVAALDDATKNAKINQNGVDNVMGALAKYGQFLSDQSYTKSAGNFLKAVQGDKQAVTQLAASYPQQLIPFRALSNWFATMTDTQQRQINTDANFAQKQLEAVMQVIPGLRQHTTTVKDPNGQPVPAQHPIVNAFSPLKISTQDNPNADYYNQLKQVSLQTSNNKILKAQGQPTVSTSKSLTGSKTLDASQTRVDKVSLPSGISKASTDTLTRFAKLSESGKTKFNADPKNKYQLHAAQYEQAKLSGKLSSTDDFKTQQSLAKEAITSNYSKEVLDFYGLSKTQKNTYFKSNPSKAQQLYDQAKKLDAQLVGKGDTTKFANGLAVKAKSTGTRKSTAKGTKSKYNYAQRLATSHTIATNHTNALRKLVRSSKIVRKKAIA